MHKMIKAFWIIQFLLTMTVLQSIGVIPYQGRMKQIITEHFIIIFSQNKKETALKTAAYAEEIHLKLSEFVHWQPKLRTIIILSDQTDIPNGYATSHGRNKVVLYLAPLDLSKTLRQYHDPLYGLILHELTHIYHIDQVRGAALFWRVFFGRSYFPMYNTFTWYLEGTAVLSESLHAKGGRLDSSYNEAIIYALAKDKAIPSFDRIVNPVVDWPYGKQIYHLGARFIEYLYIEYGKEKFDLFYQDLSNDFWPFIFLFVMKFKKIYNRPLKELWNEWKKHEENKARQRPRPGSQSQPISHLNGEIKSMVLHQNSIFLASSSYKNDQALYRMDLSHPQKFKKIKTGSLYSISSSRQPEILFYVKATKYPGDFYYNDLYRFNLKNKLEKKLTRKARLSHVDFSQPEMGILVQNKNNRGSIYTVRYQNSLIQKKALPLPDFPFIGQARLNKNGKIVFTARTRESYQQIFLYDLKTQSLEKLENIRGTHPCWIDEQSFSYLYNEKKQGFFYQYTIHNKQRSLLLKTDSFFVDGLISEDRIYSVQYTAHGEELFISPYPLQETGINFPIPGRENTLQAAEPPVPANYEIKNYNPLRFFPPFTWALLPYQLNTHVAVALPVFSSLPIIAPRFLVYHQFPLGRFSYDISVILDYMKWYPENTLNLYWKLPCLTISYGWHNWAGGSRGYYLNPVHRYWIHYQEKLITHYPINFSNSLGVQFQIPLLNYGYFTLGMKIYHRFNEFDFLKNKQTNTLQFSQSISYQLIKKRVKASRWDRGIILTVSSYQSPGQLLDNPEFYLLQGVVEGRIPFANAFVFLKTEAGGELWGKNMFRIKTDIFRINQSILGGQSSNRLQIDTKAFSSFITSKNYKGAAYVSSDTGFDITLYKRSHYWHFATIGFKEMYIKPFVELVYFYLSHEAGQHNLLFDGAFEFCVDLFVAYGNINIQIINGYALGYKIGEPLPAFNLYLYCNFKL